MIFFAIIPSFIWLPIVGLLGFFLAKKTLAINFHKDRFKKLFLLIIFIQVIVASINTLATDIYSIGSMACLTGIYGTYSFPIVFIVNLILVYLLYQHWPLSSDSNKLGFIRWLLLFLVLEMCIGLMHLRSALLCTV